MDLRLFGRAKRRRKAAVSAVIGGILLFGIILTVGTSYFYTVAQDQKYLSIAQHENANLYSEKNQENMYINTNISSNGILSFTVYNTGISSELMAYFVTNQNGAILDYGNKTVTSPESCAVSTPILPCTLNSGNSASFTPSPQIQYSSGTLTVKIVTSRGSTFIGTYPTKVLTENALTSLVASGLGSLEMRFSTFDFYNYSVDTSTNWVVNLSSAQSAAVTPFKKPVVFSAQITNNNPDEGTIVVNAHTDLWTFLSCGSGCGTQSLLGFYVMNVAQNGTVTSTSYGSFVPITIPYGDTQTIYFGSACDLSISSCSGYTTQSISDYESEHDVFMIFSGTLVASSNSTLYSQNLPFSATFTSDNIAQFSQSPTQCYSSTTTKFNLTVTNSAWSPSTHWINVVTVNPSNFTALSAGSQPSAPTGWTVQVSASGVITWTTSSNPIVPGKSLTFQWKATSPTVSTSTQFVFPSSVQWNSGVILTQPIDSGCYIT